MLLQRQNIDINVADSGEQIALFHAVKAGNEKATGLLLNCPDSEANVLDRNYLTLLWHAGSQGHVAVVNKLLWCSIIEFCPQNERLSPLIAADECYHTIFKVLLESGKVNHNATDPEGRSALWYAVRRYSCAAVRLLIKSRVGARRQDVDGVTPLDLAVVQGDEDLVQMLPKTTAYHRALCRAALTGRANIVQLLLDDCADIKGEHYYGQTPLDLAKKAGHVDVETVLPKHRPL